MGMSELHPVSYTHLQIEGMLALRREASRLLDQLKDPNHYAVLDKRYFQSMTFERIAADMNYTYRNVLYLHGSALQAFGAVLDAKKGEGG